MDIGASNWNQDDNSNTTAAPDGAPEGMAPSGVNNVLRAIMGAVKRWFKWSTPATTAGISTAYTLTYDVAPGALVDGMTHLVQFNAANGASPTLNVNALGALPLHILKPAGWGAMPANTVIDGMMCRVVYNASAGAYRVMSGPMTAVVSGSGGYSVGPNSTREQWGQVSVVGLGGSTAITFTVPFSATPYSIQLTETADNTKPGYTPTVSATGFTIVNPGSNGTGYYWYAKGPA